MNKLPMGWVEVELEKFVQFAIGGDWGKDIDFDDENFTDVFCIRGAEFRNWEKEKGLTASPRKIKTSSFQTRKLQENDILIEISGGSPEQPVGRTVLIEPNVFKNIGSDNVVCTNFIRLVRPFKQINSKYLNYYLSLFYKSPEINNYQSGSNNLRNLKFNDYLTILIPTAPKAEQDHIATLLDNHLSQVATIRQKLNDILPIIKQFRQSVLAQAVSGKLTGLQNGFDTAEISTLSKIGRLIGGKTPSKSNLAYWENGKIDWVSAKDMKSFILTDSQDKITQLAVDDGMNVIPENSVLMVVRSGILAHSFPVALTTKPTTINQDLKAFIPKQEINAKFLALTLKGHEQDILRQCSKDGTTVSSIETRLLENFKFRLPCLPEQQQIVAEVERLFAVADSIETQVNAALARVENLTQSILHQAFIGNLSADWRACNADLITGEHSAAALLDTLKANAPNNKTKKPKKSPPP